MPKIQILGIESGLWGCVYTNITRTLKSETGAMVLHVGKNVSVVVRRTSSARLSHSMRALCALHTIKPRSYLMRVAGMT